MKTPIPMPVDRALKKLGADISLARRRRHFTQASLAEGIGASTMTVRRMEKGNLLVPIQYWARALHVFGELEVFHMSNGSRRYKQNLAKR